MVIEPEYQKGLDTLLSGRINLKDFKRIKEDFLHYSKYLLPGYGLYQEWKKPKQEKNIWGMIGFAVYSLPFFIKIATLPVYIHKSVKTGKWNPLDHIKNLFIENKQNKNKGKLEKSIKFEEVLNKNPSIKQL